MGSHTSVPLAAEFRRDLGQAVVDRTEKGRKAAPSRRRQVALKVPSKKVEVWRKDHGNRET